MTHENVMSEIETIDDLIDDLIDTLDTDRENILDSSYPEDILHEYVDGQVPVYTGTLMAMAADDIDLAVAEPELGPAFDGAPTPVNIVAANIYERLYDAASEWLLDQQAEDEEDDA